MEVHKKTFGFEAWREIVGLSKPQGVQYIANGYMEPFRRAPNPGTPHKFNLNDVIKGRILMRLGELRILRDKATHVLVKKRDFVKDIKQGWNYYILQPSPNSDTAWEGRRAKSEESVQMRIRPPGDYAIVFDIAKIKSEAEPKIANLFTNKD